VDFDLTADAYSGFVGKEISGGDPWPAYSLVSWVERNLKLREGVQRKDDRVADRFVGIRNPAGPAECTTINLPKQVADYHDVKGWEE